jgi:hypothetical protein
MKNIIKLCFLSTIIFSFNSFASVRELSSISLHSGEVISPIRDVSEVTANSLQLFDGRIINNSEIKNFVLNDSNGTQKIITKGLFKIISIDSAKVGGGDNSGGG